METEKCRKVNFIRQSHLTNLKPLKMVLCSSWWCPFKIQKEKRAGLQFTSTDYLSLLLTPLRIRWTIPLTYFFSCHLGSAAACEFKFSTRMASWRELKRFPFFYALLCWQPWVACKVHPRFGLAWLLLAGETEGFRVVLTDSSVTTILRSLTHWCPRHRYADDSATSTKEVCVQCFLYFLLPVNTTMPLSSYSVVKQDSWVRLNGDISVLGSLA
jgi:hypothetical protein